MFSLDISFSSMDRQLKIIAWSHTMLLQAPCSCAWTIIYTNTTFFLFLTTSQSLKPNPIPPHIPPPNSLYRKSMQTEKDRTRWKKWKKRTSKRTERCTSKLKNARREEKKKKEKKKHWKAKKQPQNKSHIINKGWEKVAMCFVSG